MVINFVVQNERNLSSEHPSKHALTDVDLKSTWYRVLVYIRTMMYGIAEKRRNTCDKKPNCLSHGSSFTTFFLFLTRYLVILDWVIYINRRGYSFIYITMLTYFMCQIYIFRLRTHCSAHIDYYNNIVFHRNRIINKIYTYRKRLISMPRLMSTFPPLISWLWVTHICVDNLIIIC